MSQTQAVAVIIVALFALSGLLWVRLRHRAFTIPQLALWYAAKILVRVMWPATYPRPWPLAPGQGGVVICNHRSSVDPFFIQTIVNRPMRWMVAREYVQHRALGLFLRTCNVIPVGRGGIDTAATKAAISFAAEGGWVGMLPEGRINTTDEFMLPVRPGAILVALRARVPVLPCYIEGSPYNGTITGPLRMRARVRVVFGEPFDLAPYFDRVDEPTLVGELTRLLVQQIAQLAGRDDFEPKLAGRRWKPQEGAVNEEPDTGTSVNG
jgi:1-acyl-sn-glycerol-3-phosphate acyltransferase